MKNIIVLLMMTLFVTACSDATTDMEELRAKDKEMADGTIPSLLDENTSKTRNDEK